MKSAVFVWVVLVLAVSTGAVEAIDLTKIDRSIRREPMYRSTPRYCLLVFGPKAEHRVWLVLDGESLYVDRNGNGDLTDDGDPVRLAKWVEPLRSAPMCLNESRTKAGNLHVGGLIHEALEVYMGQAPRKVDPADKDAEYWQAAVDRLWTQTGDGVSVMISLDLDTRCYEFLKAAPARLNLLNAGRAEKLNHVSHYWQGFLTFSPSRAAAPVLHFGGPLTFCVAQADIRRKGDKLTANLGTVGLGRGTFVAAAIELLPDNVDPQVEIAFPSGRSGQPDLIRTFVLDDRC